MKERTCKCLVCQTEQELAMNLKTQASGQAFQKLADSFPELTGFRCALDLVDSLHRRDSDADQVRSKDRIFRYLFRADTIGLARESLSSVLILTFVPVLHSVFREICIRFPALTPEDVAQQMLMIFLEIAQSESTRTRHGHFSIAIARTLRKNTFRWAFKQTRDLPDPEPLESLAEGVAELVGAGDLEKSLRLQQFIDDLRRFDILPEKDYELLVKLKLEGFEAKELAAIDGSPSAMAVHQRIHRIMHRLRRRASR